VLAELFKRPGVLSLQKSGFDAAWHRRRNTLALAHLPKAPPDIGFFRNTGLTLVALTLLTGTITVSMTLIQF
jgi:hypothetical protein